MFKKTINSVKCPVLSRKKIYFDSLMKAHQGKGQLNFLQREFQSYAIKLKCAYAVYSMDDVIIVGRFGSIYLASHKKQNSTTTDFRRQ